MAGRIFTHKRQCQRFHAGTLKPSLEAPSVNRAVGNKEANCQAWHSQRKDVYHGEGPSLSWAINGRSFYDTVCLSCHSWPLSWLTASSIMAAHWSLLYFCYSCWWNLQSWVMATMLLPCSHRRDPDEHFWQRSQHGDDWGSWQILFRTTDRLSTLSSNLLVV